MIENLENSLARLNFPKLPDREDRVIRLASVLCDVTNGRVGRKYDADVRKSAVLIWRSLTSDESVFVRLRPRTLTKHANLLLSQTVNPDAAYLAGLIKTAISE